MLITVNGLVIRAYPTGNSDSVLHIITDTHGKLSVMVKGSKSGKKGTSFCTQQFTYGNFEIYRGKDDDLYWYRSGTVLNSFYALSADVEKVALANYVCEVASECTGEDFEVEESNTLLRLLLNTLHVMLHTDKPHALIKGVFELRAAALCGYTPDLIGCADCGEAFPDEAYLDVMNGCFVCGNCQKKRNASVRFARLSDEDELRQRRVVCPLTASTLAAMRYALAAHEKKVFSFTLADEEEESCFERAAEDFLLHNLERDFQTLHFYRSIPKLPKFSPKEST